MIAAHHSMMGGKRLPYDAEVEYLESTGTQYINTGVVGSSDITFDALVYRSTASTNECAIGSYGNSLRYWASYFFGRNYYIGMGGQTNSVTLAPTGEWIQQELKLESRYFNLYANDTIVASCRSSEFTTGESIYIGGMNFSGSANYFFSGRFGRVRLYSDGTLDRDYIPVRVGTVGYLYDRVTRRLFGNAGTGVFGYGNDK